jgi:predicted metal-dependent hydrolase
MKEWRQGNQAFNQGKYWEAHERWEQGWKDLPEPRRTRLQGMIQVAGALVLLQKGRWVAAAALARRALDKLHRTGGEADSGFTQGDVEILGAEAFLGSFPSPKELKEELTGEVSCAALCLARAAKDLNAVSRRWPSSRRYGKS